jgi:tetratricopeptide (TPR) repeat protein
MRWSLAVAVLAVLGVTSAPRAQAPNGGGTRKEGSANGGDVELVEQLRFARKQYQRSLEQLRAHYKNAGDLERMRWAEDELRQYHRILKPAFRPELEVPPPTLQARENIPEANKLLLRAMQYKDRGYGVEYTDNQRRAELLLQQLITQYPQSDKIGQAAYNLGDLYESKAYKQYRLAAAYFERAFQWNPYAASDARLRAARLYDRQMLDRGRAIELYREIITHEADPVRLEEANKRLQALSGGR